MGWQLVVLVLGLVAAVAGTGAAFAFSAKELKLLDGLQPDFRAKAVPFLVAAAAKGVPLFIYQTVRTVEQEQADIDAGLSHLKDPHNSKHVPQPGQTKVRAMDTWPVGVPFTDDATAVAKLRSLEALAAAHGLKNIDVPTFHDVGHWEDA